MWLKVFLLMIYILMLFIVSRVLEALSWCEVGYGGIWSRQLMDPMVLSVAKLKALLEQRGVSYDHVVEKPELTSLVDSSGQVTGAEIDTTIIEQEANVQTNFTSGAHFIEQVEDAKDSVWLVQVISNRNQLRIVGDARWKAIRKKVSRFGVRTGLFDCSQDVGYCDQKGWHLPFLLLALPSQFEKKASVAMHNYTGPVREEVVMSWLRDRLAERLEDITDPVTFQTKWRNFSKNSLDPEVRAVLFTRVSRPPLFYSALSVKFPGRVKFGIVKLNSPLSKLALWKNVLQREKIVSLPAYMIYSAESHYHYAHSAGEYLSFSSMERFLKFLYPCLNDIFIISFGVANVLSLLELVTCNCGFIRRFRKLIWCTFKYNIIVIMLWLPIIGIFQTSYLDQVPLALLKFERIFSTSNLGSIFRTDYTFYVDRPIFIYISFVVYLIVITALCRKYREYEEEPFDWFNFTQMTSLAHLGGSSDFIEPIRSRRYDIFGGLELFSSRLTQPSLWLHPTISSDYIQHLPTWRYTPIPIAELAAYKTRQVQSSNCCTSSCKCNHAPVPDRIPCKSLSVPLGEQSESSLCSCHVNSSLDTPPTSSCQVHESDSGLKTKPTLCRHGFSYCDPALVSLSSTPHSTKEASPISNPCCSCVQETKDNVQSDYSGQSFTSKDDVPHQQQHEQTSSHEICQTSSSSDSTTPFNPLTNSSSSRTSDCQIRVSGFPPGYVEGHQCVICLEDYVPLTMLCGLPCGHVFHETCIFSWLNRDKHFCPMCRWPSYKLPVPSSNST